MSISIFGYGSLMDRASALQTMPTAKNFYPAVLQNFERIYSLTSIAGIRDGSSNLESKEMAALAIQPSQCEHAQVLGCIFEIPESELGAYLERENRYMPMEVGVDVVADLSDFSGEEKPAVLRQTRAWTVVQQTDEQYRSTMSPEEYYIRVGQYYDGKLWGRPDILPRREYSNSAIAAAQKLGGKAWVSFTTSLLGLVLATTVRNFFYRLKIC